MLCSGLCPVLHHPHKGQGWRGLAAEGHSDRAMDHRLLSVSRGGQEAECGQGRLRVHVSCCPALPGATPQSPGTRVSDVGLWVLVVP